MSVVRYFFNIGWVVLFFVAAGILAGFTGLAEALRDDGALVWEDSCTVSKLLRDNGAVEIQCLPDGATVVLASRRDDHIVLVGNTPLSERYGIPADCHNYQSGRWSCRLDGEEEFNNVNRVKQE